LGPYLQEDRRGKIQIGEIEARRQEGAEEGNRESGPDEGEICQEEIRGRWMGDCAAEPKKNKKAREPG
jgi:hypothetical protein